MLVLALLFSTGLQAAPSIFDLVVAGDVAGVSRALVHGGGANEVEDTRTVLQVAVEARDATMARLRLGAGANPNVMVTRQVGYQTRTADSTLLEWSERHGSSEITALLVRTRRARRERPAGSALMVALCGPHPRVPARPGGGPPGHEHLPAAA